jgi:nucleoside-diphosphate-sugar epimerase
MKLKNILVTGSTGFIGKELCKTLKKDKCINLIEVSRSNGFDLSQDGWTKNLPKADIDVIIHLAQSNHYRNFLEMSDDIVKININSTSKLLDWALKNGVKRFIFASTGNVYRQSNLSHNEDSITEPNSFYGATKLAAEFLCKQYSNYFEVIITRLFGVYGPNQSNMLIPNIINKVIHNEEIQLINNEGIWLTPIYIADCIGQIKFLAEHQFESPFQIFNISGTQTITLRQIVDFIGTSLDVKPNASVQHGLPQYFLGNHNKIFALLPKESQCKWTIEMGLTQTLLGGSYV